MSEHDITVKGGSSVRLPTAGKYCDRDILVTALNTGAELPELTNPGSAEDLMEDKQLIDGSGKPVTGTFTLAPELSAQDTLIAQIRQALAGKTAVTAPVQEKTVSITENGTTEILPDEGYTLSRIAVNVAVPIPDGYVKPSGTLEVAENGSYDVTGYSEVNVDVATGGGDPDLPAGYRRADFIQFSGEQIVDTGIICNQNTKIRELFTRDSDDAMYMYGVVNTGNTASVTAYMTSSGGSWRFGNKYSAKDIVTNAELVQTAIVTKTGFIRADDTAAISGVNDFETIGSLTIGAVRSEDGTVAAAQFIGKILSFEMWDGDEPVLKLIPVTDGTVFRFWDVIGRKFHDSLTDIPLKGGNL